MCPETSLHESASRDDRSDRELTRLRVHQEMTGLAGFATRSVETVWQLACGGVQCRPSSRHPVCIQTLQSREIG